MRFCKIEIMSYPILATKLCERTGEVAREGDGARANFGAEAARHTTSLRRPTICEYLLYVDQYSSLRDARILESSLS